MNSALMFSRASDEWSTPQDFYDALNAEFRFDIDGAATEANHKGYAWMTDALVHDWRTFDDNAQIVGRTVWLNPPYSKCREFIAKAAAEAAKGCTVVCLVPSRTDTRWWHEHVWNIATNSPRAGVEVRFIKGRLKFGGCDNSAPFPSVVIIFRPVSL